MTDPLRLNPVRRRRFGAVAMSLCMSVLASCASPPVREPAIDPDVARAEIARRILPTVKNREGWAIDIFAALEALSIRPTSENICSVIAVTEQESTFHASPPVAGLPAIARREIDTRAARYRIPKFLVDAALSVQSPNGKSYRERLEKVKTEADLSDIFADFIGMVPLGERLFGSLNPVRTGGPMQVSIAYAERHASAKRYPYPISGSVHDEVFSRRGGMYFGIAHLLDYPVSYPGMVYRFADFNAGHLRQSKCGVSECHRQTIQDQARPGWRSADRGFERAEQDGACGAQAGQRSGSERPRDSPGSGARSRAGVRRQ